MMQGQLFESSALACGVAHAAARAGALDTPMARNTDPATSHAAAESARELALRHHQAIVTALRVHGPMGKDGIARRLGLPGTSVARRLPELERQGRAMPTGRTVTSDTGRQEREWRAI